VCSTIALNGSHFNAQRMLAEYAIDAYDSPPAEADGGRAELLAG
jgi:hypothetical protein